MTLEILQKSMIEAMKAKDKERKETIAGLVSAVKNVGIDKKCRDNIPEKFVDEALLKELKMVQDQIDTCPKEREDLLKVYLSRRDIIKEFAPILMSREEILDFIKREFSIELESKNMGQVMKVVRPALQGKADGNIIRECVQELIS